MGFHLSTSAWQRYAEDHENGCLNYYSPEELLAAIGRFVVYYNYERYHDSLDNLTPAQVYFGKKKEVLTKREKFKRKALMQHRRVHQQKIAGG